MIRPVLVTAPTVKPVTLAEAKAWLWVDHNAHDTLITALLGAAVAHLDGWTGVLGRCIINQVWRASFSDWPSDGDLRLPFPDVSAVVLTYYDTSNVSQTVSASNYELLEDETGSFIRLLSTFDAPAIYTERSDGVRVALTAGYGAAAANVPETIKSAIKFLAAHWYAVRESDGAQSFAVPNGFAALISPLRRVGM